MSSLESGSNHLISDNEDSRNEVVLETKSALRQMLGLGLEKVLRQYYDLTQFERVQLLPVIEHLHQVLHDIAAHPERDLHKLQLPSKIGNPLLRAEIHTIADLRVVIEQGYKIPYIGDVARESIKAALDQHAVSHEGIVSNE